MFDWTVLIPAHNAESTITETVTSVLAQRHRPASVVVYDDGSSDRTAELAAAAGDVLVIRCETNGGVGAARNELLRRASSEWVLFLDADDALLPDASEVILDRVSRASDATVAVHAFTAVAYGADPPVREDLSGPEPITHADLWRRNVVTSSAAVLRRTSLLEAGPFWSERRLVDYDMWFRLSRSTGTRLLRHSVPIVVRRVSAGSITADVRAAVVTERGLLERESAHLRGLDLRRRSASLRRRAAQLWLRGYFRHLDYGGAAASYLPAPDVVPSRPLAALLDLSRSRAGETVATGARRIARAVRR